ncbi:MAG TPA: leucine-rich repeat domain-containing protein, partial [Leptospiraceae bacterium]|nr:leucine-rich repeat domain-containing protein [Leptospiraceae bacterium]
MNKEYENTVSELRILFHSGNIGSINEGLKRVTELNDVSLEEELLSGTLYVNQPGGGGFSEWSISRNKFFTPPKSENIFEMNELEGNLWVGLISLLGRSQCSTAVRLKKEIKSLSFFGCNMPYIPSEIGSFSNLEILIVNNYSPSAFEEEKVNPLPPEIGNLKKLKWLDMSQNRGLSPPPEIGKLKRLKTLLISANIITEITDEIWNLKNLRTLNLENNRLTSVSEKIENLTELKTLKLLGNDLKTLPPQIGKLLKLEELEIMYNPLESLPEEMENLKKLKPFLLVNTKLKEFPPVLRRLKKTAPMEEDFFPWLTGDIPLQIQNSFAEEVLNFEESNLKFLNLGSFGYPKAAAAWKNIILCSTDAHILIWNADNFELLWKTSAEGFHILSISEDGKFFLCASENGLIRRYNISQSEAEFVWEEKSEDLL